MNIELAAIGLLVTFGASQTALLVIIANLLSQRLDLVERKINEIYTKLLGI